jgi:hypothetical protein
MPMTVDYESSPSDSGFAGGCRATQDAHPLTSRQTVAGADRVTVPPSTSAQSRKWMPLAVTPER